MIPILGGLGAALAWSAATLGSTRSSRLAGPYSTVAMVMFFGLLIDLPAALIGPPATFDSYSIPLFIASGLANVIGLVCLYSSLRIGAVGIVVTITSTEGAIAAVIAVAAGEMLQPGIAPVLAVIALGVVMAAAGDRTLEEGVPVPWSAALRASALALAAAVIFGGGLFVSSRLGGYVPLWWSILPARVFGTLFIVIPLAATRRLRVPRAAAPIMLMSGILEVVGNLCFVSGSQSAVAVASVMASVGAPVAAIAAYFLFTERLSRRQMLGVFVTFLGVAALGIVQG